MATRAKVPGSGRKAGKKNLRSEAAAEVFTGENFSALRELILLAKRAKKDGDRELLAKTCGTLIKYEYPMLKAAEIKVDVPEPVTIRRTLADFYADEAPTVTRSIERKSTKDAST